MKTIPCTHLLHHHNGFVATCRLWTASGGVHALLELDQQRTQQALVQLVHYEFNSHSESTLESYSYFISFFSVHISFRPLYSSVATFA